MMPKQRSSGGKSNLGTITKRGDTYLRTLLIQGAKSVVNSAHTRSDPISRWPLALKERSASCMPERPRPHRGTDSSRPYEVGPPDR